MYFFQLTLLCTQPCSRHRGFSVDESNKTRGSWAAYILAEPAEKQNNSISHICSMWALAGWPTSFSLTQTQAGSGEGLEPEEDRPCPRASSKYISLYPFWLGFFRLQEAESKLEPEWGKKKKRGFCQDPVGKTETAGVIFTLGLDHKDFMTQGCKSSEAKDGQWAASYQQP